MRKSRLRSLLYLSCLTFTSIPAPAATVITLPATGITNNSATLNATANPTGISSFGHFEYGTTTNYGSLTSLQNLGSGSTPTNFSQVLTGLAGGTSYHFRAYLEVGLGLIIIANDQSFFLPAPPSVVTLAATSIHPGQATLNATINPNNLPTLYWFQHGPVPALPNATPANTLDAGTNLVAVSNLLTDLPRGVPYYFE